MPVNQPFCQSFIHLIRQSINQFAQQFAFDSPFTHLPFGVLTSELKSSFPALTGVAALAYFVQNCVLSITRAQKFPENNVSVPSGVLSVRGL